MMTIIIIISTSSSSSKRHPLAPTMTMFVIDDDDNGADVSAHISVDAAMSELVSHHKIQDDYDSLSLIRNMPRIW